MRGDYWGAQIRYRSQGPRLSPSGLVHDAEAERSEQRLNRLTHGLFQQVPAFEDPAEALAPVLILPVP